MNIISINHSRLTSIYAHMIGINLDYNEVLEDAEKIWNWVSENYEATYYPQVSVGWDASRKKRTT